MKGKILIKLIIMAALVAISQKGSAMLCDDLIGGNGSSAESAELQGKSIFQIFSFLSRASFKDKVSSVDLSPKYKLNISTYWPSWAGRHKGSFALSIQSLQSGRNSVYLRIDEQYVIRDIEVIEEPAHAIVALSALTDLPGMEALRDYLHLPMADAARALQVNQVTKVELVERELHDSVTPLRQLALSEIIDSDAAMFVSMGEYALLRFDAASGKSAIKTFGASSCVIVVLHEPISKTGILMHLDAFTDFEISMRNLSYKVAQLDLPFSPSWNLAIISGDTSSSSRLMIFKIRHELQKFNFNLVGQNILTGNAESAWLDLDTGGIFHIKVNKDLASYGKFSIPQMYRRPLTAARGSE